MRRNEVTCDECGQVKPYGTDGPDDWVEVGLMSGTTDWWVVAAMTDPLQMCLWHFCTVQHLAAWSARCAEVASGRRGTKMPPRVEESA